MLFALGAFLGFGLPYAAHLDRLVRERFAGMSYVQPSRVYARPLRLVAGVPLTPDALLQELEAARYREVESPLQAGSFSRDGASFELVTRPFRGAHGAVPERHLRVSLAKGRVSAVVDADSRRPITDAVVDPARIGTLYGPKQEERRFVRLADVPPLLVAALQAVEDRSFKYHGGLDLFAIIRAAWVNVAAGEVVQGGSTLTQQLVRNVFLDRSRTLARKANEAVLALLIEARYSKQRILEAYVNEVYLGQQGAQAVHGIAAAAEFYFGRELQSLAAHEIALLIGLIQGPSLYDPRRFPERAKARRDLVLKVMEDTGLLEADDRAAAMRAPLGVVAQGALTKNRYPAFLDLVRSQIESDFPDAVLRSEGLSILTTLAPSTQRYAEAAVAERLKAMGAKGAKIQAGIVVTQTSDGAVEAVVGDRNPGATGFNRALNATRPIGSLVKPFVYLVALAQPQQWSLMSTLSDRTLSLRQPNGRTWTPANVDNTQHGDVALIDALARSYNLATVRLGLEIDVGKVERVLEALIPGADVSPHPSLLLGATDLSPYQMAQAYQYLAADGRPQPLRAVEAVLDADGKPLTRYARPLEQGDLVEAARLVTFAMQHAAKSGTASALGGLGLAHLKAAGKTGTSNDQRDSWFAGYTGSHLAVVWLGADDNSGTGLFGSTGALRVWASLFARLPTTPLALDLSENPLLATVDTRLQRGVDAGCPGARSLPFMRGYEPIGVEDCGHWRTPEWEERYGYGDPRDDYDDLRRDDYRSERQRHLEEERRRQDEDRPRRRWRDWFRRSERDDDDDRGPP